MYLDPGAGSVVLQAILAAVLGAGVFIKMNWGRIKSRFFKNNQAQEKTEKNVDREN